MDHGLCVPAAFRNFFALDVESGNPASILLSPAFLPQIVDIDDVKFKIAL
jgi:hypothetical protein